MSLAIVVPRRSRHRNREIGVFARFLHGGEAPDPQRLLLEQHSISSPAAVAAIARRVQEFAEEMAQQ
jgi:hypothetical protein